MKMIGRVLFSLATVVCLAGAATAQDIRPVQPAAATPASVVPIAASVPIPLKADHDRRWRGWSGWNWSNHGWPDRRDHWRRGSCEQRRSLTLHGYWERTPGGCTWRTERPDRR